MNGFHELQPSRVAPSSLRAASVSRQKGSDRQPRFELGDPGRCPGHPSFTICLFDDSGSVAGPVGTDPLSNRYREAAAAFHALARNCRCGQCRAAVVHFDLVGGCEPVRLARRVPHSLVETLAVPPEASGLSVLGSGLDQATRMASVAMDVRDLNLVVFSDFELFDPNLERVLADLAAFPGQVHAVVLGGHSGVTLDPVIQVTRLTTEDVPGATARALLRSLTAGRRGARIPAERQRS